MVVFAAVFLPILSANAAVSSEQINLDVVNAALMLSKDQLEILIAIHSTKPPIAYTVY